VQEWHGARDTGVRDQKKKKRILQEEPRKEERMRRDVGKARNATWA
jgi:hypothetical protein